jgi:transcriptional regulator with XRE-family HTH domain
MKTFGENIKQAQKRAELNTLQLSYRSGVNRGTLRSYFKSETAQCAEIINNLCETLNITPNELLSYGEYEWERD